MGDERGVERSGARVRVGDRVREVQTHHGRGLGWAMREMQTGEAPRLGWAMIEVQEDQRPGLG